MLTRRDAMTFAQERAASRNRPAIDSIVDHFLRDCKIHGPSAAKLPGSSIIMGRDAIRTCWHTADSQLTALRLTLDRATWDNNLQRRIVRPGALSPN